MNLIHKEFLIALANGEEIECKRNPVVDEWFLVDKHHSLAAFENSSVEFRIKPKTVTISYEIPMPFVPEIGDRYWYFEIGNTLGVASFKNVGDGGDKQLIARGVYRTEDEAIQALAAQKAAIAKLLEGAK